MVYKDGFYSIHTDITMSSICPPSSAPPRLSMPNVPGQQGCRVLGGARAKGRAMP